MGILVLIIFLTLSISAMCSLFEAILYSTRIGTLEAAKSKGRLKSFAIEFLKMKKEIAIPIAAILILNTIANTAGATIAGMYATKVLGSATVPIFSVLFTLGILFLSEIIPKTIGAVHWRSTWYLIVFPLTFIKFILYPLIYLTQIFSNLITRGHKTTLITEEEILAAARMGFKEGEISAQEHRIIDNLINLENKTVREIMTPRRVIFSLADNLTIRNALEISSEKGFTRIPIYNVDKENIIGYVMVHDLSLVCNLNKAEKKLGDIIRPISYVDETINCLNLLTNFLKHKKHIAIVVDEYDGVAGLVTLEDIIETLLGTEIVDETDKVVDLQKVARHIKKNNINKLGFENDRSI